MHCWCDKLVEGKENGSGWWYRGDSSPQGQMKMVMIGMHGDNHATREMQAVTGWA